MLRRLNPCNSLLSKHTLWALQRFPLSHPYGHSSAGTNPGNCSFHLEGMMDPGFKYWLPIQLSSLNSPQCLAQYLQLPYFGSHPLWCLFGIFYFQYDTRRTHSVRTAALHDGFSAHLRTLLLQGHLQRSSAWVKGTLPPLPGEKNTGQGCILCSAPVCGLNIKRWQV